MSIAELKEMRTSAQEFFSCKSIDQMKWLAEITKTLYTHGQTYLAETKAESLLFSLDYDYPFNDDMRVWDAVVSINGPLDKDDQPLIDELQSLTLFFSCLGEPIYDMPLKKDTTLADFWYGLTNDWGGEISF